MSRLLRREPVRVLIYSALALIVGALALRGLVTGDDAVVLLGLLAAVLGVPATEAARSRVSPVIPGQENSVRDILGR